MEYNIRALTLEKKVALFKELYTHAHALSSGIAAALSKKIMILATKPVSGASICEIYLAKETLQQYYTFHTNLAIYELMNNSYINIFWDRIIGINFDSSCETAKLYDMTCASGYTFAIAWKKIIEA